ncbi:MAG: hypothetical protein K1X67_03690 [Fimbriimonadaceae bacterium]|nr:hypothetical protein [Fimbriimonadaceae bacterium]
MEVRVKHLNVWFWRYLGDNRNYAGLHFTAKKDSCLRLRDCLEELRNGRVASFLVPLKALQIQDEARINGQQSFQEDERLHLRADMNQGFPIVVGIEDLAVLLIAVNLQSIDLLASVFREVERGAGDTWIQVVGDSTARKKKHRELPFWYWPCYWEINKA